MSSDSTEITFVRCPSCRSLVPAASTRCRMCGAKLDAAVAQAPEPRPEERSRRVRQRTVSESHEEVGAAVSQIREEASDTSVPAGVQAGAMDEPEEIVDWEDPFEDELEEAPEAQPATQFAEPAPQQQVAAPDMMEAESSEDDEEDPLSDYLEDDEDLLEDDLEDFLEEEEEEFDMSEIEDADDFEDFEDLDSLEDEVGVEPLQEPVKESVIEQAIIPLEAEPVEEELPVEEAASAPIEEPRVEAAPVEEMPVAAAPVQPVVPRKEMPRPRVVVETGGARKGGGLSFSRKVAVPAAAAAPQPAPVAVLEQRVEAVQVEAKPVQVEAKIVEEEIVEEVVEAAPEVVAPEAPVKLHRVESVRPIEERKGRLAGWLVNYSDPAGRAVELREGRFFATRNSLKASDLIIDDPSIATPHALIMVSAQEVKIQDLMSERGVFHRESGSDAYQREIDPFVVRHGDWIRIGDVEFTVSLIAHIGKE